MKTGHTILRCAACTRGLPTSRFNAGRGPCPHCGNPADVLVLPAFYRETPPPPAPRPAKEGEVECYACQGITAEVACDQCGRLMCSRCDVPFQGGHLCLACLGNARKDKAPSDVDERYVRMDHIAFTLTFAPWLIIFYGWLITFITASAALYLCARYWNRPISAAPRNHGWYAASAFYSVVQVVGWMILAFWLIMQAMNGAWL